MDVSEFSRDELLDAADAFMENMKSNAERLSRLNDGYKFAEDYLKAIAYDDFDGKMLYGMAVGEKYERPEEYERTRRDV